MARHIGEGFLKYPEDGGRGFRREARVIRGQSQFARDATAELEPVRLLLQCLDETQVIERSRSQVGGDPLHALNGGFCHFETFEDAIEQIV
jgi:hypothetical protein